MTPIKNLVPERRVVLACLDLSEHIEPVLWLALMLAQQPETKLHIAVVGTMHDDKIRLDLGDKLGDFSARAAAGYVQVRIVNEAKRLVGEGSEDRYAGTEVHVAAGDPAKEIVMLAAQLDADVIVVGTHGRQGAGRWVLGSVAEAVVRTAGCPVVVAREKNHDRVTLAQNGDTEFPMSVLL
jgi:nucleotide-binding universal stress UspA family protein